MTFEVKNIQCYSGNLTVMTFIPLKFTKLNLKKKCWLVKWPQYSVVR